VGLAPRESPIVLARGDTLVLTRAPAPGVPAVRDPTGAVVAPARVACTLPKVFATVQPGEPIKLDDGKIEGFIRRVTPDEMEVEITRAKDKGSKLKADKAINLPESDLQVTTPSRKGLPSHGQKCMCHVGCPALSEGVEAVTLVCE
jgi:pyruvate kinase